MSIADKLTQIAENEQRVYNAGYEKGKAEAEPSGDSYYDTFWDAYQQGGNRTVYTYAFYGRGWTDETFKPKYNLITNSQYAWEPSIFQNSRITDLDAILKKQGVTMLLAGALNYMFEGSTVTNVTLDCSKMSYSQRVFSSCANLVSVELQNLSISITDWFGGCSLLQNIKFTGTSAINSSVSFSSSILLTKESLMNIINALADRSATTALTLTIGAENLAKLTEEEIAIATEKGWTVV